MSRKRKNRRLKPSIAIVCEGETEMSYFNNIKTIKKYSFEIKPHLPQHSDINHIYKKAKEIIEDEFDIVFCVFDADVLEKNEQIRKKYFEILEKASKKYQDSIYFIDSMPCFELWLLLHFKNYKRYTTDQNEVISELKNFLKDYKKGDISRFFSVLNEKINEAINIAKDIEKDRINNKDQKYSYTNVHRILLKIKDLNKV